ncbi:uncharacterized protein [Ptychodera flava]|uniref:uncharacterized protein n=1 Tax=Ptychodera flava TaxID=63121 RepID=UPI00396A4FFC
MEGSVFDMKTKPTPEQQIRLQNELLRLQIRDGFLVNYTGSWLKTVQWLLQLTTMATKLHESGVNENLMSFAEFDELVKVNRRLPPPEDEQLQMRSGTLFKLNGTHFVEMIFSDFQNEVNFADAVSADVPSVPMRHRMQRNRSLLVIENLREYNKERQKLLDRALAAYINHPTPTVPAQEIVETALTDSVHELIHFDAFTYWQLWMQVHIGVSVCRTETADETQKVQRLYEEHHRQAPTRRQPYPGQHNGDDDHDDGGGGGGGGHGNGGNRYQTHGRNQRRSNQRNQTETDDLSPELDHRDLPTNTDNDVDSGSDANIHDNQDSGGTFTMEDFAQDSQSEDAMLQQVIALSTENSVNDEEQMRLALELSKGQRQSSRQRQRRNDATAGNSDTVQEDEILRGTRFSAESAATAAEKSPRQQGRRSPGSTRKSTTQVAPGNSINSDDTAAGRKRRSPRQAQHDENSRGTGRQQDDNVRSRYSSSPSVTRDAVKSPRQQRSRSPRGSHKSASRATPRKRHNSNDATQGKKTPSPAQMQHGESSKTTPGRNTKSPRMRGRKRIRQTDPTSSHEATDGIAIVQDLEDEDLKRGPSTESGRKSESSRTEHSGK